MGNRAEGEVGAANVGNVEDVTRRAVFPAFLTFMRRLAGMPDYASHIEHLRRCHPGEPIPSEREFFESFLQARYGDGPTRCC